MSDHRMSMAQELHLNRIKQDFIARVDAKYRAGAREHGGQLLDKGALAILDYAIDEAVDQVVYLLSLRELLENSDLKEAA